MKKYVQPGMRIAIDSPATVGMSCSVADISIDWSAAETFGSAVGNVAKVFITDEWRPVFREEDSGKLFYDDEMSLNDFEKFTG